MSRFRTLQKTVSKSKHYLIDLQHIKCIFAQYLSKFSETYFEHPTFQGVITFRHVNPGCRCACPGHSMCSIGPSARPCYIRKLSKELSPHVQGVTGFRIARDSSNSKPLWNCPLMCKGLQTFVLHAMAPTQSFNGYVHILTLFAIEEEVERELIFAV